MTEVTLDHLTDDQRIADEAKEARPGQNIEVTGEMVAAGFEVLDLELEDYWDVGIGPGDSSYRDIVRAIYRAMEAARLGVQETGEDQARA